MKEFRRLIQYLQPYRITFALSIVLMIATGLFEGATRVLVVPIFNKLADSKGQSSVLQNLQFVLQKLHLDQFLPSESTSLTTIAFLLVGFTLAKGIAEYFSSFLMSYIGQHVIADVRSSLYDHVMRQSAKFFAIHPTNNLTAYLMSDAMQIERSVSDTLRDMLRESVSLILYLSLLFSINWKLAGAMFLIAPPVGYLTTTFNKKLRKYVNSRQQSGAEMLDVAQEAISSQRVVKAFGMERYESERFAVAARKQMRDQLKAMRIYFISPIVLELIGVIAIASLLIYVNQYIESKQMTLGDFAMFIVTMFSAYDPIRRLSRLQHDLQQGLASASRIFKVMDTDLEMRDKPDAVALQKFEQSLEFQNVSFSYGAGFDIPVVEDVSFKVAAGEMLAIVGQSGAGKSTLTNLIPRLYEVTKGKVLIDGHDVRDLQLATLRSQIAMVTQEVHLFNDTVRANLAYGSFGKNDSDASIKIAAKAALADEFISNLPNGYDTVVGERGLILSGGQRQRIAIARAILKDAPILILDEATSALDTESELFVQQALNNLMEGRTTIVIAHRLSTVRKANRIIVMDAGRIAEIGSHQELMANNGIYRKLYDLQFADDKEKALAEMS